MKELKLNLGCASHLVDGWINVDYAIGVRVRKIPILGLIARKLKLFSVDWNKEIFLANLTKKFPWPDDSVKFVYSSHTVEHFTKMEGQHFFKECHRVMRDEGIIRIIVPDLNCIIKKYQSGEILAEDFIDALGVSPNDNKSVTKRIFSTIFSFPHKCMYDEKSMIRTMELCGFRAEKKEPFMSQIPNIESLEIPSRTNESIIVEAMKI